MKTSKSRSICAWVQGRNRILSLLPILLSGLLAGCQSLIAPGDEPLASFVVGKNEVGESCRLVNESLEPGMEGIEASYGLICGQWSEPSARIFAAPNGQEADTLLTTGWWRSRLDHIARCEAPTQTRILDDVPGTALDCTLRTGGWPYQAIVTIMAGKVYMIDSIPTAYPVAERALGVLTGHLTPTEASDTGKISKEIVRLEARLSAARYNAGDIANYLQLLHLAQKYNHLGDYHAAEMTYRKALELHQQVLPGQDDGLAYLYMHVGLELSNQEQFNRAEAEFAKAQDYLAAAIDQTHDSRLVSYRALHLANQRRNVEALTLARQATDMRRVLARQLGYTPALAATPTEYTLPGGSSYRAGTGALLSGIAGTALGDIVQSEYLEASMLVLLDRLKEARSTLEDALRILEQEPRVPRSWEVLVKLQLAWIAEREGEYARAEKLLISSIYLQHSLFNESRTEGHAWLSLGRVRVAQGRSVRALQAFRSGFDIFGKQGAQLPLDEILPYLRILLAETKRYPDRRGDLLAEMFEAGQLVRGVVVSRAMALTAARLSTSDNKVGELIRELQDTRRISDELRKQITLAQSDPRLLTTQINELEQRWADNKSQIAELERQVQIAAPRYNQLVDTQVSTKDVLGALRPGEAISQILVGSSSTFGFFVDTTGISAYEIKLTEQEVRELVKALRHPFEVTDRLDAYPVEQAHELYRLLFTPVATRLRAAEHVITVPSGDLISLPFGLLVVEPSLPVIGNDYSTVHWMARRHALTLAPSVQSFVNLRTNVRPSQAEANFIGFGDFVPGGDETALLRSLDQPSDCKDQANMIAHAPRLPDTAEELRSIAEVLEDPKNKLVLGSDFSETTIAATPLENYRVISFATHGLLPSKLRCLPEPALVVSRSPDGDNNDGLLMSSEVVELNMDADLVVLSACDTGGSGDATGGEALSGLARAFFYAGARSLLVTHWEIPSAPTTRLLVDTFEQGARVGTTIAEALRESQTDMIEYAPWSHPKAWAGFSVVGDGGEVLTSLPVAEGTRPPLKRLTIAEVATETGTTAR